MTTNVSGPTSVDDGVERLSSASARRVIEPDTDLPGRLGSGRVLPDELLSIAGLDLDLTDAQRAQLSREELAAILQEGVRFDAALAAGFALQLSSLTELTDPRVTYVLHELGEEARHSRLFVRLLDQLGPQAENPLERGVPGWMKHRLIRWVLPRRALFCVLVLAGKEIPDLIHKRASEHPGTDPFLRLVNRYHREEEARHLGFARLLLPEVWARAGRLERLAIRHAAPRAVTWMFDGLVHPGVYRVVGLPGWRTWWRARRSPARRALRHESTRPVLDALVASGAFDGAKAPRCWRALTGTRGTADGTVHASPPEG